MAANPQVNMLSRVSAAPCHFEGCAHAVATALGEGLGVYHGQPGCPGALQLHTRVQTPRVLLDLLFNFFLSNCKYLKCPPACLYSPAGQSKHLTVWEGECGPAITLWVFFQDNYLQYIGISLKAGIIFKWR